MSITTSERLLVRKCIVCVSAGTVSKVMCGKYLMTILLESGWNLQQNTGVA